MSGVKNWKRCYLSEGIPAGPESFGILTDLDGNAIHVVEDTTYQLDLAVRVVCENPHPSYVRHTHRLNKEQAQALIEALRLFVKFGE